MNNRFTKLFTAAALAFLMLAGTILALPEATQPAYADFVVSNPSLTGTVNIGPQLSYSMTASGFRANTTINISVDGTRAKSLVSTDGNGDVTTTVTIPAGLTYGSVTVLAEDTGSDDEAQYTATITPTVSVAPDQAPTGADITIRGQGFAASEVVTSYFVSAYDTGQSDCIQVGASVSETLGTDTTNNFGRSLLNTTVPNVGAGTYYVVTVGASSATCAVY